MNASRVFANFFRGLCLCCLARGSYLSNCYARRHAGAFGSNSARCAQCYNSARCTRCAHLRGTRGRRSRAVRQVRAVLQVRRNWGTMAGPALTRSRALRKLPKWACASRCPPNLPQTQSRLSSPGQTAPSNHRNVLEGDPERALLTLGGGRQPWQRGPRWRFLQGRVKTQQILSERTVNVQ